ncbi:MAG: hypothetical protein MHM6MM_008124 [Cercozoa sp. M6MM]
MERNFDHVHFDFYAHQVRGYMEAKLMSLMSCDDTLEGMALPSSPGGNVVPASALYSGARFELAHDDSKYGSHAANGNGVLLMVTDGYWPVKDYPMAMSARSRISLPDDDANDYSPNSGRFYDTSSPRFVTASGAQQALRFSYVFPTVENNVLLRLQTTADNPYRTFVLTARFVGNAKLRMIVNKSGSDRVLVYACKTETRGDLTHTAPPHYGNNCYLNEIGGVFNPTRTFDTRTLATITIAGVIASADQYVTISCAMLDDASTQPCTNFLRHAEPVWATQHNPVGTRTWVESYYTNFGEPDHVEAVFQLPTRATAKGFVFADGRVTLRLPPGKLEQLSTSSLMRNYYFDYVVSQWRVCFHPGFPGFNLADQIDDYTVHLLEEMLSEDLDQLVRSDLSAWNSHPSNGDIEIDLRTLPAAYAARLSDALATDPAGEQPRLYFSARAEMQLNGQGSFPFALDEVHAFPWRTSSNMHQFAEGSLAVPVVWSSTELSNAFAYVPTDTCRKFFWCGSFQLTESGAAYFQNIVKRRNLPDATFDFDFFLFVGDCDENSVKGASIRNGALSKRLRLSAGSLVANSHLFHFSPSPGQKICIRPVADTIFAAPTLSVIDPQSQWRDFRDGATRVMQAISMSNGTSIRKLVVSVDFSLSKFVWASAPILFGQIERFLVMIECKWPVRSFCFCSL